MFGTRIPRQHLGRASDRLRGRRSGAALPARDLHRGDRGHALDLAARPRCSRPVRLDRALPHSVDAGRRHPGGHGAGPADRQRGPLPLTPSVAATVADGDILLSLILPVYRGAGLDREQPADGACQLSSSSSAGFELIVVCDGDDDFASQAARRVAGDRRTRARYSTIRRTRGRASRSRSASRSLEDS